MSNAKKRSLDGDDLKVAHAVYETITEHAMAHPETALGPEGGAAKAHTVLFAARACAAGLGRMESRRMFLRQAEIIWDEYGDPVLESCGATDDPKAVQ